MSCAMADCYEPSPFVDIHHQLPLPLTASVGLRMAARSPSPLIRHPALWRGSECARVSVSSVPTGFAELDVLLPGGGWPTEALTEICAERPGIGEMQLLMPALARLTRDERWLTLIAPPYRPYAPALAGHGVHLSHVLLLQPEDIEMRLWACEQTLRAGNCGAVLLWLWTAFRNARYAACNGLPGEAAPWSCCFAGREPHP